MFQTLNTCLGASDSICVGGCLKVSMWGLWYVSGCLKACLGVSDGSWMKVSGTFEIFGMFFRF